MNHDELNQWSKRAADWATEYHAALRDRPVRAPLVPGAISRQLPPSPPEAPEPMAEIFADFDRIVPHGITHDAAKVLKGFGGAGVLEVVEDDVGGTYRAVYTVKFAEAVFVLHCFQKKSKRGIATPKEDLGLIHARLKIAEAYAKELRK